MVRADFVFDAATPTGSRCEALGVINGGPLWTDPRSLFDVLIGLALVLWLALLVLRASRAPVAGPAMPSPDRAVFQEPLGDTTAWRIP